MNIRGMLNRFKENKEMEKRIKELEGENEKLTDLNNDIRFTPKQIAFIKHLIFEEEVLNSHSHGTTGLYSILNMPLLDFVTDVRVKLQSMEEQNGIKEDWYK